MGVYGNATGGFGMPKMIEIVDENGNSLIGVVTKSEITLNVTDNDVRENVTYAGNNGISMGTKFIPPYYTSKGMKIIKAGKEFELVLNIRDAYDYTSMQCIICKYNTSLSNSVYSDKVVIENNLYAVNSTDVISVLSKDVENKSVKFGIINESDVSYIVRYFTYKEEL